MIFIHKTLKNQFFIINHFFETASYLGQVPVIKCYSFVRNEISNNIKDSFIEKHYTFIYINIMIYFFPVKINNCGSNTVGIC